MMSATKYTSLFNALPAPGGGHNVRCTPVARILSGYTAAVVAKLRAIAPYALIELVLPGGSVMALLLWLYRRQRKVPVSRLTRFSLFYRAGWLGLLTR
jgi:hypothetical protein